MGDSIQMNNKYIVSLLAAGILLLSLAGCGENKEVVATKNAIDSIGEVTIDSQDVIEQAEALYNNLPTEDQQAVTNYDVLVEARNEYDILCAETAIDAIGEVTSKSGETIEYAKKLYEALSLEQQKQVQNYDSLNNADEKYTFIEVGIGSETGWDYFSFSEDDMTIEKVGEPDALEDFGDYFKLYKAVESEINYIFEKLNLPDSLLKKVRSTSSKDGTLSERHNNVLITWSYDSMRDNSLYIQFKYEPTAKLNVV